MRTPGDDFDLAIGYLLTEGIIEEAAAVHQAMHCLDEDETGAPTYNVVDIMLVEERPSTRAGRALLLHHQRLRRCAARPASTPSPQRAGMPWRRTTCASSRPSWRA